MRDNIALFWDLFFSAYHKAPHRFYEMYQDKCRYYKEED